MKDRDTFKIGNAVQFTHYHTKQRYFGIIEEILPEGLCREMAFKVVLCNGGWITAFESELKHLKR